MPIKLVDTKVRLDQLLLDPDNYRVIKNTDEMKTGLTETIKKQDEIYKALKKQKLADLKDSILKNGFLTVDRIVIKPLTDEQYLVIEGNRRVAALKSLIEDFEKGYIEDPNINEVIEQTKAISAVLIKGTEEEIKNYSNALMGIRHVSGAKKWHGWQSAKLVNSMFESGHKLSEIGEMLGITSIDAGRRMRGYKAFQQLEHDSEYGSRKETHHYALLLEFLSSQKKGRDWLEWNEDSKSFQNEVALKRLYQAIIKDDDGKYEVRNINDARDFLEVIKSRNGQQKIMNVSDFRDIDTDESEEITATYETTLIMLKNTIKDLPHPTPNEVDYVKEIIKLANNVLEMN